MPSKSYSQIPIADMRERVARAQALVAELNALFPGLSRLTDAQRKHSRGRMRTGESEALRAVLDAADKEPAYFKSLAQTDHGVDPLAFETELLRDRLLRRELLQALSASLGQVISALDDSVLQLGEQVRPATLAAYRIAKALARSDVRIGKVIAKAIAFFGGPARAKKTSKVVVTSSR